MKKAMGMFAALLIALGMSGVGYACWSQTIFIEGSVETGEVCVGWLDVDCYDDEYLGKDVAWCDCWLEGVKGEHNGDNIYETLVIELNNVYPSYEAWIEVDIANGGTIPVNLVSFDIHPIDDPDNLVKHVYWYIYDWDWPYCPQIDPCNIVTAYIHIHILEYVDDQLCPQDATATFEGELVFNQWNE